MGLRGGVVAALSLEKPESKTPPRHFDGGYRPVLTLSLALLLLLSSSSSSPPLPLHIIAPPPVTLLHSRFPSSLHGSDLAPRHAGHPGVHHRQCVRGLQHPGGAPDRTGAGYLQTRKVRVRSQRSWSEKEGWFSLAT